MGSCIGLRFVLQKKEDAEAQEAPNRSRGGQEAIAHHGSAAPSSPSLTHNHNNQKGQQQEDGALMLQQPPPSTSNCCTHDSACACGSASGIGLLPSKHIHDSACTCGSASDIGPLPPTGAAGSTNTPMDHHLQRKPCWRCTAPNHVLAVFCVACGVQFSASHVQYAGTARVEAEASAAQLEGTSQNRESDTVTGIPFQGKGKGSVLRWGMGEANHTLLGTALDPMNPRYHGFGTSSQGKAEWKDEEAFQASQEATHLFEKGPNAEIACEKCTLLNDAGAQFCLACQTPLPGDQCTSASNHRGNRLPQGGTKSCPKCTFLNYWFASMCACCESSLGDQEERQNESEVMFAEPKVEVTCVALVCHTCNAALMSRSNGHQLSGCHHSFCRMCLGRAVAQQLLTLKPLADMQTDDMLAGPITCPAEGCHFPLSREDLRVVLGASILGFVDDWLMSALLQNVLRPALHRCPNCNEHNAEPLLLPDDLETLKYKQIRMIAKHHAFNTSGRARRSKSYHVNILRDALAATPDLSLCSTCCCLICRKCGDCLKNLTLKEVASAHLHPHQCNPSLKQCFDMARSVLKLCAAYSSYVEAAKDSSSSSGSRSGKKRGRGRGHGQPAQQDHGQPALLELKSLAGWLQEVFGKGNHVQQQTTSGFHVPQPQTGTNAAHDDLHMSQQQTDTHANPGPDQPYFGFMENSEPKQTTNDFHMSQPQTDTNADHDDLHMSQQQTNTDAHHGPDQHMLEYLDLNFEPMKPDTDTNHGPDQHMLMNVESVEEQQNPTGNFEVESYVDEEDDYSEGEYDFTVLQRGVVKPTHIVDNQAQEALSELTNMLESLHNENMGFLPPAIVAMLCSHELPRQVLTWLVRNDSARDIVARSKLYWQLMAFMRTLSECSALLPLLCSPQAKHDCWLDISRWETPGSVIADFRKLYTQAQFKLRGELQFEQYNSFEECDQQSAESLALMAEIKETYKHLLSRMRSWEAQTYKHEWLPDASSFFYDQVWKSLATPAKYAEQYDKIKSLCKRSTSSSSKKSALDHNQMREAEYKKALGHLQFGEVSLLPSHYFRNVIEEFSEATVNKKRARTIAEEITQLSTTLPLEWASSIFVRIDEQRYDMMRALIIGPAGTPYQNGVFLFDIMFGEDYPHKPPKVQFLTTGGGRVRFNPNLYDNGYVCLSLLGTWSGPAWNPAESTLYQVLVSIQALVLVADPYYNEPGYQKPASGQCQMGRHYMLDQRLNTLCYSILPALQTPDPVFEDVITAHFRLKASEIQKQCDDWICEETRESTRVRLIQASKDVQQELAKLANGNQQTQ